MTTRQKALLVATFLLALSIRLFFVGTVFEQSMAIPQDTLRSQNTTYIAEDSRMYLRLAFEAMENGILSAGNERRTPGYPLFLALLGISPLFVLFTQCVLVSLIPAGTYYLILKSTQRTSFALIAGIYLAVHPSLVGVSGFLIPDALFCVLFFFAALTLWWATSTNKNSLFLLSGLLWAAGLLVKPVLLLGIVLAPLLSICLAYALETKIKRLPLLLLIVPLITLATGWSAINYTKTGMFTYSTIGTFTAHEYLAARVEASKELGRLPTW
ncbi:MAG: glycosyltransferase family 39 protein, partial [Bdellovibrionales bacterium]|nr:glycosyltransferase family 39 protein [Bdellovibrionales bacterium]